MVASSHSHVRNVIKETVERILYFIMKHPTKVVLYNGKKEPFSQDYLKSCAAH